jgi:hypothetical protein
VSAPTWEQIVDGMIARLDVIAIPQGGAESSTRYLRFVERYLGQLDPADPNASRKYAGRCPGVFVDFAGEKEESIAVGRRVQELEGTFLAICLTDSHRSRQDRDRIWLTCRNVRAQLVSQNLGLDMTKLRYKGLVVAADKPHLYALGLRFTTNYRLETTMAPATNDTLNTFEGTVTKDDTPPTTLGGIRVTTPA